MPRRQFLPTITTRRSTVVLTWLNDGALMPGDGPR